MSDEFDLGEIDNREALVDVLGAMQERISDLEGRVDALHTAREYLIDEVDSLRAENEELQQRLSDIGGHVELVDASLNTNQKGKIEKIMGILEYADRDASGGRRGVTIKTGEVAAASGASRNTALRLMDELGATFPWASVENPGGPKAKILKIDRSDGSIEEYREDVRSHYAEGET